MYVCMYVSIDLYMRTASQRGEVGGPPQKIGTGTSFDFFMFGGG